MIEADTFSGLTPSQYLKSNLSAGLITAQTLQSIAAPLGLFHLVIKIDHDAAMLPDIPCTKAYWRKEPPGSALPRTIGHGFGSNHQCVLI